MPVLVTDAHRPLARRLVERLLALGGEVRAYAAGDVSDLRARGAIVARGEVDDEGMLEAAMADVHTVVHLGGGLHATAPRALAAEARTVARAAEGAGVARLIGLSLPGADPTADEPLRQAKGEEERALASAAPPSLVVRASLVDTPALRDALATAGLGADLLEDVAAPVVAREDLVALLVALDDARSRATEGHLVLAAEGPRRLTLGEYLERVGAPPAGRGSLVGRRLTDDIGAPLLRGALRAGPWSTTDEAIPDGFALLGVPVRAPGP